MQGQSTKRRQSQSMIRRAGDFALEALESRRMLSASLDASGTLTVHGSSASDTILVSLTKGSNQVLGVWVDGVKSVFDVAAIKQVDIYGGAGTDTIQFIEGHGKITLPAFIFEGKGNDTIMGGSGQTTMVGSGGNNLIIAGAGHAEIHAGRGNNRIIGQGNDDIFTGNGDNDVSTGGPGTTVHQGHGHNQIDTGAAAAVHSFAKYSSKTKPNTFNSITIGETPVAIRSAYQLTPFDNTLRGDNQTIAIVDAFDDPTALNDFNSFSNTFHLPGATPQNFQIVHAGGHTPAVDGGWAGEISLDIEWAHAIAPNARIVLVEADSNMDADLVSAVNVAAQIVTAAGGGTVSMSFGQDENAQSNALFDGVFNNAGYSSVTFVASSGDTGSQVSSPAISPNVISVGGTTLPINSSIERIGIFPESAWADGGGGVSALEASPSYQAGLGFTMRAGPDIAYEADPNTGVAIYDTTPSDFGSLGWQQIGGTSLSAPMFAATIALANQLRQQKGMGAVGNQLHQLMYSYGNTHPNLDYFDIVDGSNGHAATPGFDLATGWGVPIGTNFIDDLAGQTPAVVPPINANVHWSAQLYEHWNDVVHGGISSFAGGGTVTGQTDLTMAFNSTNIIFPTGLAAPTFTITNMRVFGNSFVAGGTVVAAGVDKTYFGTMQYEGNIINEGGITHIFGEMFAVRDNGDHTVEGLDEGVLTGHFNT